MVNPIFENLFKRGDESNRTSSLLKKTPLFCELDKSELIFLEKIVHIRHYRAGEPVFQIGETGVGMFVISEGCIEISDDKGPPIHLKSGDFFGELALAEENSKRTVNAVASMETDLIGFFKPDLEEIKQRNSAIGVKILGGLSAILATRLRESVRTLREGQ